MVTPRNCVALINALSGKRQGRNMYNALQAALTDKGIPHTEVVIPNVKNMLPFLDKDDDHGAKDAMPVVDTLIVVGGDGTLSSVANVIAMTKHDSVAQRPVVLVAAGDCNSVALSLGLGTVERSLTALFSGRVEPLPIWEVSVNHVPRRYIVSTFGVGTFSRMVTRQRIIKESCEDYVGLPTLYKRLLPATIWETLRNHHLTVDATVTLTLPPPPLPPSPQSQEEEKKNNIVVIPSPLRTFVASQIGLQQRGFSLTPHAHLRQHGGGAVEEPMLSVTVANHTASRLRMLHLMSKEATAFEIMEEDGVQHWRRVKELTMEVREDTDLVLDGEVMPLRDGPNIVSLRPTNRCVNMAVP